MRYLLNFSYDGSSYNGYQRQNNKKTIQGEIEKALKQSFNKDITIHGASRTDSGVHAISQYAHFDMDLVISPDKIQKILNKCLKPYIYIKIVTNVSDDFHARYNVVEKEYQYIINTKEYNPLDANYCYQYNKNLDIKRIKQAVECLIGKHDFEAFTTNHLEKENHTRIINSIAVTNQEGKIIISFCGNGFLKHMIRNIIGCLIDVGSGKKEIDYLSDILNKKTPRLSKTVPGAGLYLQKIKY